MDPKNREKEINKCLEKCVRGTEDSDFSEYNEGHTLTELENEH